MENTDPLLVSSTLLKSAIRREVFDPSNSIHVESFKSYVNTNRWGKVQFHVESPFLTVEQTVLVKFAKYALNEI